MQTKTKKVPIAAIIIYRCNGRFFTFYYSDV